MASPPQPAWPIETALLDNQMDYTMDDLAETYESMDEAVLAALGFSILLRYEGSSGRPSARLPKMKNSTTTPIPKMNTRPRLGLRRINVRHAEDVCLT